SGTTRAAGALGKAAKSVIQPKPSISASRPGDRLSVQDGTPHVSKSNTTAAGTYPLDNALRHTSNADGLAWAQKHMPLPDLTKEEVRALHSYGGPGYLTINPALRAKAADPNIIWSPNVADHIAAIDRAIAKSRLPNDVVLHRGVGKSFLDAIGV